jgi:hypothetical protein
MADLSLSVSMSDPLAYADAHFLSDFGSLDESSSSKRFAELGMLVAEKVTPPRARPPPAPHPHPQSHPHPHTMHMLQDSQLEVLRQQLQASREKENELQVQSPPSL